MAGVCDTAARDLAIALLAYPLAILGGMILFNNGSTYNQTTLFALVIVAAISAGVVGGITVLGSGGNSSTSNIAFLEAGLGAFYGVLSAVNVNTLLSFGPFTYLYALMSGSYILGMIVVTTP